MSRFMYVSNPGCFHTLPNLRASECLAQLPATLADNLVRVCRDDEEGKKGGKWREKYAP